MIKIVKLILMLRYNQILKQLLKKHQRIHAKKELFLSRLVEKVQEKIHKNENSLLSKNDPSL